MGSNLFSIDLRSPRPITEMSDLSKQFLGEKFSGFDIQGMGCSVAYCPDKSFEIVTDL